MRGKLYKARDILHEGDEIVLSLPDDPRLPEPVELPLSVAYEDDDVLVLDKGANMPVHPTKGHERDTLANAVAAYLTKKGESAAFRPVNRLDRDTTGLVLAAKHSYSAPLLAKSAEKVYYAVCEGILSGSGTIDAPLRVKEGHGIQRETGEGGVRAVTHYTALHSESGLTLLEIHLETGRTHQIRAHFASIGIPLAGDDMYGGSRDRIARQALHCGRMSFIQPISGEKLEIVSALPEDIHSLVPGLHKP